MSLPTIRPLSRLGSRDPGAPHCAAARVVAILCLFLLLLAAAEARADLRTTVQFRRADLRLDEGDAGVRAALVDAPSVGGREAPSLPMVTRHFYIPEGFEVLAVRVTPERTVPVARDVVLATERVPAPESEPDERAPYPPGAIEADAPLFPARPGLSLGGGSVAGFRVHTVALFPVRWSAAKGELLFTESFTVELELRSTSAPALALAHTPEPARVNEAAHRTIARALASIVENAEDIPVASPPPQERGRFAPEELPSFAGSGVDMVIVTTAEMASEFQALADWKTLKGVPTVVRTVSWVDSNYPAGHDTPERIRMFLQDAYVKWGTYLALLGGDYEEVPPRLAFSRLHLKDELIPTDQYYSCLEGNWNADGDNLFGEGASGEEGGDDADLYPDLFVGRAPVQTTGEAAAFVAKSLNYEQSPPSDFFGDFCALAEVIAPWEWECGDPPTNIVTDGKTYAESLDVRIPSEWARSKRYQSECDLSRPIALEELSYGHHLLSIIGHGDAYKLSVGDLLPPFIYAADADTLTNGERLPFLVTLACGPNQLDVECIGESFVNNPNGGAIAMIGATREDIIGPTSQNAETMMQLAFQNDVTRLGAMTQLQRIPLAALAWQDQNPARWVLLVTMLFGDPELRFWTQEPASLVVSHASSLELGTGTVTVTVTDTLSAPLADALVCVSDDVGTYSRAYTDASGQAVVPLTSSEPTSVSVVVSLEEHKPYEGSFSLTEPAGAELALTDVDVDDDAVAPSSGNGDGVIDAGERLELSLSVHNGGGSQASGAQASVSIDGGSQATFDLLYDGVRDSAMVYVGRAAAHPATIPFTLDFANPALDYWGAPPMSFAADSSAGDQGVFLWQDQEGWHLRWGTGTDSTEVSGTVATDGRVRRFGGLDLEVATDAVSLSAGEDTLSFSGWTHARDLSDGLEFALSDSTLLSVFSGTASLGDIASGSTQSGTVVVDVSTSARGGQVGYVDVELTASSGGPWAGEYVVLVAGPELESYVFDLDDSGVPPTSGDGDGIAEVGETVRLTPSVLNRGSGSAVGVVGEMSAPSGVTFVDSLDAYGEIASLTEATGTDGYLFTLDDSTATLVDLVLTDGLGRTWSKSLDFVVPSAPTGLVFTSTESSIALTWDARDSADVDLAGYLVYRSTTSGSGFAQLSHELIRSGARYVDGSLSLSSQFYYQVTGVDSSGNESSPSAELYAWTTQKQQDGWPQAAGNRVYASLAIADADGNGAGELYVGSQDTKLYAWNSGGIAMSGFPVDTNGEIWGAPGLGDLDKDDLLEVMVGSRDNSVYAVHHDGSPVGSQAAFVTAMEPVRCAITLADVDFDSRLEFFFGSDGGNVYGFDDDGTGMIDSSGVLITVPGGGTDAFIWGTIAVADLDDDLHREIVFSSWNDSLYVITPQGARVSGFPRGGAADFKTGPVVGDLDNDGTMEILAGNSDHNLYAFNHDGTDYVSGGILATLPDEIKSIPSLANLDADPELEIVVTGNDGRIYAYNHDGSGFLNPNGLLVEVDTSDGFTASPIIVDVDGDSDFEIFAGHRNGNFYGYHLDGSPVVGFPFPTSAPIHATAAAGDLDGDGDVEIAFASYDEFVRVLDFDGASTPAAYEWPTFAGNNHRTSVYGERGPFQTGAPTVAAPAIFALAQNAPNPFGPRTMIRFSVPREGPVSLKVFNVGGRLVRTLVDERMPAGPHAVRWDGRDEGGRALASGVYFYRLDDGDRAQTRKSVLLR